MSPVFINFNELPSTHEFAINLLSKTTPQEATVIVAGHQTNGKGRYERTWDSQAKSNLLLSSIFYPNHLSANQAFQLNIISTLATTTLLADYTTSPIEIKWPNDVLVDHQKIAGTLIQNQFSGTTLTSSVISIGLNVNQIEWNDQIFATSIKRLTGQHHDIDEIAQSWISNLISYYQISKTNHGLKNLKKEWKSQLAGFSIESTFEHASQGIMQATLIDVNDDGKLVLEINGRSKNYHMDEIRHVRKKS